LSFIPSQRECYEWINTCSQLLSDIKGKNVRLLNSEEEEQLLEEEVFTTH
jgi:hypothetical protein